MFNLFSQSSFTSHWRSLRQTPRCYCTAKSLSQCWPHRMSISVASAGILRLPCLLCSSQLLLRPTFSASVSRFVVISCKMSLVSANRLRSSAKSRSVRREESVHLIPCLDHSWLSALWSRLREETRMLRVCTLGVHGTPVIMSNISVKPVSVLTQQRDFKSTF